MILLKWNRLALKYALPPCKFYIVKLTEILNLAFLNVTRDINKVILHINLRAVNDWGKVLL